LYQGTISGAFKNALDWLHLLGDRDPPFLHDKVIVCVPKIRSCDEAARRRLVAPLCAAAGRWCLTRRLVR
jgi:NAD(P)H-dependent FMN reductase